MPQNKQAFERVMQNDQRNFEKKSELISMFKLQNKQNMLSLNQSSKRKAPLGGTVPCRMSEKSDKAKIKLGMQAYLSKPGSTILSHKSTDISKISKTAMITPKSGPVKQSLKENCASPQSTVRYRCSQNVYTSPTHSSTPIDIQPIESKCRSRNDYKFIYQVGSGGFGHVWKVQDKKTGESLAMKEISKAKVIEKKSVALVANEKLILQSIKSPFIINMKSAFQDRDYLYLLMEYLRGGDLRYHLCFYERFNEQQTKFIAACIIVALQYIHSRGIIHRDLKPENLVFEASGYLRVTDFGVARAKLMNNSEETSGTPGYMAPEVICRMDHSFEVDFFALGVIVYELMLGERPYTGNTRKQIRDKILAHQARIREKDIPQGWSTEAADFVNRLIRRNRESRLGSNGILELKKHAWLSSINWKKLSNKQLTPPYVPGIVTQSRSYQKEMQNTSPSVANEETQMLLRTPEIENLFRDYDDHPKQKKSR